MAEVATPIEEYVIGADPDVLVDRLLSALTDDGPRIIGLGVYIWNVTETTTLCRHLRERAPDVVLVAGGPEVSHETEDQPITALVEPASQHTMIQVDAQDPAPATGAADHNAGDGEGSDQ